MARRIETVEEFVRTFDEFLDEEDPMTPEEIDAQLREAGYDPEEVGARMQAVAERALAESPWNWRSRAQQELEDERVRIVHASAPSPLDKASLIAAITSLIAQSGGQMVYAHRNLESETEEDLASLLAELEYLVSQQHKRSEE